MKKIIPFSPLHILRSTCKFLPIFHSSCLWIKIFRIYIHRSFSILPSSAGTKTFILLFPPIYLTHNVANSTGTWIWRLKSWTDKTNHLKSKLKIHILCSDYSSVSKSLQFLVQLHCLSDASFHHCLLWFLLCNQLSFSVRKVDYQ